jgi:hypothetical protein
MGYSNAEKEEAILRIVQGRPNFKKSRLATRRVDATYEEVSELVQTSFFYDPDAIFYLLFLSSNYYTRSVNTAVSIVEEMLTAIDDLLVKDRAVEDVSSLSAARRALQDMDSAVSKHGFVSKSATSRYTAAINRSKDALGRPVKLLRVPRGGVDAVTDIVMPRSKAKSVVSANFKALVPLWSAVRDGIYRIISGLEEYTKIGVASKVVSNQLKRAIKDLSGLDVELSAMTPLQRTTEARDALLRVLVNKGTVKALSEGAIPGAPKLSSASGYRASSVRTGSAPFVEGAISAPWRVENGLTNILQVDVGGTIVTVDLTPGVGYDPGVEPARLEGGITGNFRIGNDLSTPYALLSDTVVTGAVFSTTDTSLYIIVDGIAYRVDFVADLTALQVAGAINIAVPTVVASVVVGGGLDRVKIEWNNGAPPTLNRDRYIQVATGVANAGDLAPWSVDGPLGVVAGSYSEGWDANNELWIQANTNTAHTVVALTSGAWPTYSRTAAQVVADIVAAGGADFTAYTVPAPANNRVVIESLDSGDGSCITIRCESSVGLPSSSLRAATMLGFTKDQSISESDVAAQVVLNILNNDTTFNSVAVASLSRDSVFQASGCTVSGLNTLDVTLLDQTSDPTTGWGAHNKVIVGGGENAGSYNLVSATWVAVPPPPVLTLELDRQLRDQTATNRHIVSVVSDTLKITAIDNSVTSYIDVDAAVANSAHAVLGLTPALVRGTSSFLLFEYNDPVLGWIPADISRKRINIGDTVVDATGSVVATVTDVTDAASGVLGVTAVASNLTLTDFSIVSVARVRFYEFVETLKSAYDSSAFTNLDRIDRVLAPVLILDDPSVGQVNAAYAIVDALRTELNTINAVLRGYSLDYSTNVEAALRSLLENGHDRARDLLLQAKFSEYFGVTARTASYSRALLSAGSSVTVEDINEPTKLRGEGETEFDRVVSAWIEDEDPAYDLETEMDIPDSPLIDYWPGEVR